MRYFATVCAILLVVVMLCPIAAIAKPPQGGGGGSNWHGNWNSGVYWGHAYGYHGVPYVVQRPVYVEPILEPTFSGAPIRIFNPMGNKVTLSYMLNGVPYSMAEGYMQELRDDRQWVIDFSRGSTFGQARYGLEPGQYTFTRTDHGWELYRRPLEEVGSVATPANPAPPALVPANPSQTR